MKKDEEDIFISEISGMELEILCNGLNQMSDFLFSPIKRAETLDVVFVYELNKNMRFNQLF